MMFFHASVHVIQFCKTSLIPVDFMPFFQTLPVLPRSNIFWSFLHILLQFFSTLNSLLTLFVFPLTMTSSGYLLACFNPYLAKALWFLSSLCASVSQHFLVTPLWFLLIVLVSNIFLSPCLSLIPWRPPAVSAGLPVFLCFCSGQSVSLARAL